MNNDTRPPEEIEVDLSWPEDANLVTFTHVLASLGIFVSEAASRNDMEMAAGFAETQQDLLLANPEGALLVDEVFGAHVNHLGPYIDAAHILDSHGKLDDIDIAEVLDRTRYD